MPLAAPRSIDRLSNNPSQDERLASLVEKAIDRLGTGPIEDALEIIAEIEALAAGDPVVFHLVGLASFRLEEPGKALAAFQSAQKAAPDIKEYAEGMSVVFAKLGNIADSLFYAKLGIAAPNHARFPDLLPRWFGKFEESFFKMGDESIIKRAVRAAGRQDWIAASALYRKAAEVEPDSAEAWRGLIDSLCELGHAHDALASLQSLSQLRPDDPADFSRYACAFELAGCWEEAASAAHAAASRLNTDPVIGWLEVRTALRRPDTDRDQAAKLMARWGERFGTSRTVPEMGAPEIPMARRRLRLGVFSSCWLEGEGLDLILPLLAALPRRSVDLHVYADGLVTAPLAVRARGIAAEWHEIDDLDDETIAFMLTNDGLDALIDLDGPLRRRRHMLFARHPAPLALSMLDLPEACGACGFDAAIGDEFVDSGIQAPILRLPGALTLPKDPAPLEKGATAAVPVFGSLAARREITGRTASLWTAILNDNPGAILRLMRDRIGGEYGAKELSELFPPDLLARIEVGDDGLLTQDYLASIDVLLDPLESSQPEEAVAAASRGIPIVTLPGSLPARCVLGSWLRRQELNELVAADDDGYVTAATAAIDPVPNAALRERLLEAAKCEADVGADRRAQALEAGLRMLIEAREARL